LVEAALPRWSWMTKPSLSVSAAAKCLVFRAVRALKAPLGEARPAHYRGNLCPWRTRRRCRLCLRRIGSPARSTSALSDRIFTANLEAFELRMVEIERLVLAGVPMGKAECFRLGPGFDRRLAPPYRVGGIERVVLVLGSLEQMKLDEARDFGQLSIAAQPHLLEGIFRAFLHTESVHGNEHQPSPDLG